MKSHIIKVLATVLLVLQGAAALADPTSEQLYYELDRTFPVRPWQVDLGFAYDFNNPYLHVMGGQAAISRAINPFLQVGVTGDFFSNSQKQAARVIEAELARHGETLTVFKPQFVVAAQAKLIPLIGYINLFSKDILNAEVGPIFRVGVSQYEGQPLGQLFGTGLDINMSSKSGFGFHFSVVADWEKVNGDYMSRIGVRLGPSLRF